MKVKKINIRKFKRFHDLTIQAIPETTRLVVLAGPNGCGKSSLFDALLVFHKKALARYIGYGIDKSYHLKAGLPEETEWTELVNVEFHQQLPSEEKVLRRLFYFRSAYRNEADFIINSIQRFDPNQEQSRLQRLIDNDSTVSINYQKLVSETVSRLYAGTYDSQSVEELREELIHLIRNSIQRLFGDLLFTGPGNPLEDGTFFFTKGASQNFHYKNLSAGEKAAFDLILDLVTKRESYTRTIFCIDEPETHMNSRLQKNLLNEIFELVPRNCQLWVATHSIGMMRCARDLQNTHPGEVVFLDFDNKDFDVAQTIEPQPVNRLFWERTLRIALDDLTDLVAPQRIVICEGMPRGSNARKLEFDAQCYRAIFSDEFPDTQFLSAGSSHDVETDRLSLIEAIKAIASGVEIIRVVDRDDKSENEIRELKSQGVHVLSRRHLECYLFDDEILTLLCEKNNKLEHIPTLLESKEEAIRKSVSRGHPPDDVKSASGDIYNAIKSELKLTGVGNTVNAFCRDTLAPLITPKTSVYTRLKKEIFRLDDDE